MVRESAHPMTGFASRITWMLVGPAVMFLAAMAILRADGWMTVPDIVFLAALGVTIMGRWVEYLTGDPRLADGEPARAADVRRYTLSAIVIGLGSWAALNWWANYWAS